MKKIILTISIALASFGFFAVRANASTTDWTEVNYTEINIDIEMSEMNAEKSFKLFKMLYDGNFIFYDGSIIGDTINDIELIKQIGYFSGYVYELYILSVNSTLFYQVEYNYLNETYLYHTYNYNDNIKLNGAIEITRGIYSIIFNDGENFGYNIGLDFGYNSGYNDGYVDGDLDGYINGYNAGVLQGENQGYIDGYVDGLQHGKTQGYNDGYAAGENDGYAAGEIDGYDTGYNNGYDTGYISGYNLGYNDGYEVAITDGSAEFGLTTLLAAIFGGLGTLLSIQLLPNITIGMIIAVPVVFGIISFILGKRGGKDD